MSKLSSFRCAPLIVLLAAQALCAQSHTAPANYVLGSDDVLSLSVADLEEISDKPLRIDKKGDVNIPLAGRVHAAGLTVERLETEIELRLRKQLNEPHAIVSVAEFRSQPVSILGAVNTPGVHQLEGRKRLFEVLSLAGGLRPDSGSSIKITRGVEWGRIPLPSAQGDATGEFSVASVSVKNIMNGLNPAENIAIMPQDTITVPKADLVYVIGSVKKPGGYVLGQNETVSALQVLSMAEGLDRNAASAKARVMRIVSGRADRAEIPLNLKKLIAGKMSDFQLRPDDILFVPNSAARSLLIRSAETAVGVGSGIAIYSTH